jgi:hypothetical protein
MDKKEFDGIWENVAKIEIGKIDSFRLYRVEAKENNRDFRETVYSRYQSERDKFRKTTGIAEESRLDRHKVAAFFYTAFVDNVGGHSFNVFGNRNERLKEAEFSVTHEAAFNIACGILENFIVNNSEVKSSYRQYVEKNGLTEPELICFDKISVNRETSYKEETLKQIILAQKEGKLSVSLLAVLFSSIEKDTINSYKLHLAQASA